MDTQCSTTFDRLEKDIGDGSFIKNLGSGQYLINANIEVANDAKMTISHPVTWPKITNKGSPEQYHITVRGSMDINEVKITSWDPEDKSAVEQDGSSSKERPYIVYEHAEGAIIKNSELAYLGFAGGERRGLSFIDGSANIEFKNNDIHDFWFAFYFNGARNITIDGNRFHDNRKYAIDPHTGTRDMNITNNLVYDNAGIGIICSLDCRNVLIENNTVYNHTKTGINLSRNMHDSIVRNNTIYNSDRGILMNESPDSDVYGNIIFNVTDGFYLLDQSRSIDSFTTKNRIFNNTIRNADNGIVIRLADDNVLSNNAMENITSYEYALEGGAEVAIMNQHFSDDRISGGSGTNIVTISDSGTITNNKIDSEQDDAENAQSDCIALCGMRVKSLLET